MFNLGRIKEKEIKQNLVELETHRISLEEKKSTLNRWERVAFCLVKKPFDFTIFIEHYGFKSHEAFLRKNEYFRALFDSNLYADRQVTLSSDFVSVKGVQLFLEYLYFGVPLLSHSCIDDVYYTANYLGELRLIEQCHQFLMEHLNFLNVSITYEFAVNNNLVKIKGVVANYLIENYQRFVDTLPFLQVSVDLVRFLLELTKNGQLSEVATFKGLLLWLTHHPSLRSSFVEELFSLLPNLGLPEKTAYEMIAEISILERSNIFTAYTTSREKKKKSIFETSRDNINGLLMRTSMHMEMYCLNKMNAEKPEFKEKLPALSTSMVSFNRELETVSIRHQELVGPWYRRSRQAVLQYHALLNERGEDANVQQLLRRHHLNIDRLIGDEQSMHARRFELGLLSVGNQAYIYNRDTGKLARFDPFAADKLTDLADCPLKTQETTLNCKTNWLVSDDGSSIFVYTIGMTRNQLCCYSVEKDQWRMVECPKRPPLDYIMFVGYLDGVMAIKNRKPMLYYQPSTNKWNRLDNCQSVMTNFPSCVTRKRAFFVYDSSENLLSLFLDPTTDMPPRRIMVDKLLQVEKAKDTMIVNMHLSGDYLVFVTIFPYRVIVRSINVDYLMLLATYENWSELLHENTHPVEVQPPACTIDPAPKFYSYTLISAPYKDFAQ